MFKWMKQVFRMLLMALVVLSLGACEGSSTTADHASSNQVQEETYQVSLTLESEENLLFSKYDVEVYLDEKLLGTIDHGAVGSFRTEVTKGQHTLMLIKENDSTVDGRVTLDVTGETALRYRFESQRKQIILEEVLEDQDEEITASTTTSGSSTNSQPSEVTEITSTEQTEASQEASPDVLTQEHPDLAAILSSNHPELGRQFAEQYKDKIIEFDGHVAYINPHGNYKTRYDLLIYGGDWVSMEQTNYRGINMQFSDVATTSSPFSQMDGIGLGSNIRIKARVIAFTRGELLQLEPIEVTNR